MSGEVDKERSKHVNNTGYAESHFRPIYYNLNIKSFDFFILINLLYHHIMYNFQVFKVELVIMSVTFK